MHSVPGELMPLCSDRPRDGAVKIPTSHFTYRPQPPYCAFFPSLSSLKPLMTFLLCAIICVKST